MNDVKAVLRSLAAARTYTAMSVIILALGSGAGTLVFSVVDGVVLRGLPFERDDRLAVVLEHAPRQTGRPARPLTTAQTYLDWRRLQRSFDGLAAIANGTVRLRTVADEPITARTLRVSHEFFAVLRVAPAIGRSFTADDETPGRHRVVILSHGFWQRHFGGARDVAGRTLELDEQRWEILGVMPRDFSYPVGSVRPTELFVPVSFGPDERTRRSSQAHAYMAIGRLEDGVTLAQANDDMTRTAAALGRQYPGWNLNPAVRVVTLREWTVGQVRPWMLMLLGAVALVLLIACANVANLMLARATVRRRDLCVRAALGAGRWPLMRLALLEGLVLSLAGALMGLVLGWIGVRALAGWLPANLPRIATIRVDWRVLAACLASSVATGLLCSAVPAVQASRAAVAMALKEGDHGAGAGGGGQRLRNLLVVSEVAMATMLLIGAGLFTTSFIRMVTIDPGFDYRNVLVLPIGVSANPGADPSFPARSRLYVEQVLEVVRLVPGVEAVGSASGGLPLAGDLVRWRVAVPGRTDIAEDALIDRRLVSPDYLKTLRIPLERGRHLTAGDRESTAPVVIVNQAAARAYWPGQDPIGRQLMIAQTLRTVVGVAGDIRHRGPEAPVMPEAYVPSGQERAGDVVLVVRTRRNPLEVLPAVRAAIWTVNREQRLAPDIVTLEGYMDRLIAQRRLSMVLVASLGVLALVIAAAGIFGVLTYVVAQRTREIGLRIALGARPGRVVWMVIGGASQLTVSGLAIGGAAAWHLSAAVKAFLFQVEPNDPRVFAAALGTLAAAGLLASVLPARRAANVDPTVALRAE